MKYNYRLTFLWIGFGLAAFPFMDGDRALILALALLYYAVGNEFYLHRYCSHGVVRMGLAWEGFFWLFQLPNHLGDPMTWAATHGIHHRYPDTPRDFHSPHHYNRIALFFRWFAPRPQDVAAVANLRSMNQAITGSRFHRFVHDQYYLIFGGTIVALLAIDPQAALTWFIVPGGLSAALGGLVSTILFHTVGYQNFKTTAEDQSRNCWQAWIVSPGGCWHNNHHQYPTRANHQVKWWEFDLVYWVCCRPFE